MKKTSKTIRTIRADQVTLPPLVSNAIEVEDVKMKLARAKKKIASAEKAIATMRAGREALLDRYRQLQRKLADEALVKPE